MIRVGDIVRLIDYNKTSINSHARVDKLIYNPYTKNLKGYLVSNTNMPFNGTLNGTFVYWFNVKTLQQQEREEEHALSILR